MSYYDDDLLLLTDDEADAEIAALRGELEALRVGAPQIQNGQVNTTITSPVEDTEGPDTFTRYYEDVTPAYVAEDDTNALQSDKWAAWFASAREAQRNE